MVLPVSMHSVLTSGSRCVSPDSYLVVNGEKECLKEKEGE